MPKALILKTGTTLPELRARRGDFENWIAAGMGLALDALDVVDVAHGELPPEPARVAGVVVTGSSAMVSDAAPWSEDCAAWLARAVDAQTPVLGICYGHQLLARALGGEVGPNPLGREIGCVELQCQPAAADDPLLGVLGERAAVHTTHRESVLALPSGARWLAASALDPWAAFAFGERAWGVQFHPEFDADVMRSYLETRRDEITGEGLDADALLAGVREAPAGARLLRRFADLLRD